MNTALSSASLSNSVMIAPHSGQIRSVSSASPTPSREGCGIRVAPPLARSFTFSRFIFSLSFREPLGNALMCLRNPMLHHAVPRSAATPESTILANHFMEKSDNAM
jgi:hypothetical protein